MALDDTLALPFFDDDHRRFAEELSRWADAKLPSLPHDDVDAACRARVKALGEAGLLKAVVPASHGGLHPALDVRTLCLAREILAFRDGLADFAFAMQGLGTGSISLFGSDELKRRYLPPVRDGKAIAAFALSEPEAGSDVAALATTAKADGAAFPARRRKDLDIERRNRRPLRGVRAHRRGAGRPRAVGLRGRCRYAGADGRRAHRGDRAASAGAAHVRRRARAGGEPAGQARRGLQGGDGDARHLPLDGGRRGAGLCPPRAARDHRARGDAQAVRRAARRSADDAGGHRRQRHRGRCRGAAGLSRRLDQGSGRRSASPARRRWPRCSRPKPRSA